MRELLDLSGKLHAHMLKETEAMLSERLVLRYMSEARASELLVKRDEELLRIDNWAAAQKEVVKDVFWAMIKEAETDKQMHVKAIGRLSVDDSSQTVAGTEQPESMPAAITRAPLADVNLTAMAGEPRQPALAATAQTSPPADSALPLQGGTDWLQTVGGRTSPTLLQVSSLHRIPISPAQRERRKSYQKATE